MRYMLLSYDDEKAWERAGPETYQAAIDEAIALCHDIDAKGQYLLAAPLYPSADAINVQVRDGKRLVTDGPFVETHEQLGGFYLIDVPNVQEAIGIAERHSGARLGTVEVRQLVEIKGLNAE